MKDNVLLIQVNVPNEIKEKQGYLDYAPTIYSISNKNVREYADRIGCDYKLITECKYLPNHHPAWQRFGIFTNEYDKYNIIIYMDSDYITHAMTPNILDVIKNRPEEFFAVVDGPESKMKEDPEYFNSGFFIIKRPLINRLKKVYLQYADEYKDHYRVDQDALNAMRPIYFPNYCKLSSHWNGILAIKRPLFATHYCALRKRDFKASDYYRHETYKLNTLSEMSDSDIRSNYFN